MFLDETEIEDFESVIAQHNLTRDDFEISTQESSTRSWIGRRSGKVEVRYKPSGVAREYRAGSGTRWSNKFIADLRAGVFRHR